MDLKLTAFLCAIIVVLVNSAEAGMPGSKESKPKKDPIKPPKSCPPEKVVKCLINPCSTAFCPRYPMAFCKPNYCGSCKAEFFFHQGAFPSLVKDCGKHCSEACPRDYDPVCGSDKQTYGNMCTFNAARCLSNGKIIFAHHGECDEISS